MKKIIFTTALLMFTALCFSSEVGDLLKKAFTAYKSGDITGAITYVDSARKLLDAENLQNSDDEYIEVTNWDVVKLKKDSYLNKKVKIQTVYSGISGSKYIMLRGIGACEFQENLVDKILSLEEYKTFTFYGTVKDGWSSPSLFVEAIE